MLDFAGLDAVLQRLAALGRQATPAAVDAIDAETELILFHSQPLVPVDTGRLLASGHTNAAHVGGDSAVGEIRYGDAAQEYAILVHEDTSMNHPHGGQSHFLSQPLFEDTADMLQHFAAVIGPKLRG